MIRSCMVSRARIEPGDTVVAVVLRQMPWLPTNAGYLESPTDLWAPVSLPVYGKMGHLGLDEIEDSWVKDVLFTWIDDFADEDPKGPWAVGPLTPDTWSGPHAWVEMEKRIRQGTLMCSISEPGIEKSDHTLPVGITYILAEVYDDLSDVLVDVEVERALLEAVRARHMAFQVDNDDLAEMARSARQLHDEMSRLRFEIEDNNVPFFGEGALSFHRMFLSRRENVDDTALLDLLQFDAFQNHLRLTGTPWLPSVRIPE